LGPLPHTKKQKATRVTTKGTGVEAALLAFGFEFFPLVVGLVGFLFFCKILFVFFAFGLSSSERSTPLVLSSSLWSEPKAKAKGKNEDEQKNKKKKSKKKKQTEQFLKLS
jgi:hypothetical protein